MDKTDTALLAFQLWNLSYLYGNIPVARQSVETLNACGWPTSGMVELVERHWRNVPTAQEGWATHPKATDA